MLEYVPYMQGLHTPLLVTPAPLEKVPEVHGLQLRGLVAAGHMRMRVSAFLPACAANEISRAAPAALEYVPGGQLLQTIGLGEPG